MKVQGGRGDGGGFAPALAAAVVWGLVPVGVVTVTSTVPAAWLGAVAVIDVSELKVKVAGTVPNRTLLTPVKSVPVMFTTVPPPVLPVVTSSDVTAGAEAAV